ncbi:hypothetical protein NQ317_005946 [Molorchus minor]|uniref:Uncharacterized protein n=1 Tax=Molorchus minor TaxID=1323400 RepID=A0ABQ9IRE0_9CUCU|nr:hypothetical protein NQ317_005946 [Molorchus minor]
MRKQFATQVAKGAPSQEEERRISNYMSHDYNIHKRIYDQSTSLVDITRVSKHLEKSVKCEMTCMEGQNQNANGIEHKKHRKDEQMNSRQDNINYQGYSDDSESGRI